MYGKSICVFIHFHEGPFVLYYVHVYLNELAKHFDEVVFLSNNQKSGHGNNLRPNIKIIVQENKGYDFGRFYAYTKDLNLSNYNRIACVNDSNILLNTLQPVLKWSEIEQYDLWGLIDSHEKPWFSTSPGSHHIQSHFMILNRKAIDLLREYYQLVNTQEILNEKNSKTLRRKVIDKWEIGFSQFLISKGLTIGSLFESQQFNQLYHLPPDSNCTHRLYHELLEHGYPLIKKKVIGELNDNGISWETIVETYGNRHWELLPLIEEINQIRKPKEKRSIFTFFKNIFQVGKRITQNTSLFLVSFQTTLLLLLCNEM